MVLNKLGDNFKNILKKISGSYKVDRELIEEVIKEIQKSLLSTDVNVRLVLELTKKIRERALKEDINGINKQEHLISLIYEELTKFLGDGTEFELKDGLNKILLIGLYGQGKTTTAGKLALYFKNRGKKVALLSLDIWRPAAYEQLKQLGELITVPVYGDPHLKNPLDIYNKFKEMLNNYDIAIIDTAGRDNLSEELVTEIKKIYETVEPTDVFLVIGADLGQNAGKQAIAFKESLNITGVIITKLDGTGKGGGALSACSFVNAPVRFIGIGEKIEDLERFNSKKFVSQLLGMGDIETLLEKVNLALDKEKSKNIEKKLLKGEFDLEDMYEQLKSMKKMGSLSKLLRLIPGLGSLTIDKSILEAQEKKLEQWRYAMDSMTKEEKKDPSIFNPSRIKRVAKGSGVPEEIVRELLKHYKQTKKLIKMFKNMPSSEDQIDPKKLMKLMKKRGLRL